MDGKYIKIGKGLFKKKDREEKEAFYLIKKKATELKNAGDLSETALISDMLMVQEGLIKGGEATLIKQKFLEYAQYKKQVISDYRTKKAAKKTGENIDEEIDKFVKNG